jgi:hypothetical protein
VQQGTYGNERALEPRQLFLEDLVRQAQNVLAERDQPVRVRRRLGLGWRVRRRRLGRKREQTRVHGREAVHGVYARGQRVAHDVRRTKNLCGWAYAR